MFYGSVYEEGGSVTGSVIPNNTFNNHCDFSSDLRLDPPVEKSEPFHRWVQYSFY